MRKDLARLREFDASDDIKKTLKKKVAEAAKTIQEPVKNPTFVTPISPQINSTKFSMEEKQPTESKLEEILKPHTKQEQEAMLQTKKYANEDEKQQIFLLQSQKNNLENKIRTIVKEEEPPFLLEKNRILIEQKKWQEKIVPLIEQERKIEEEQKIIENKEGKTNISQEKQNLERERWQLDEKRKGVEKQRWMAEEELSKLQHKIGDIEKNYKNLNEQGNSLKSNVIEIDNSLMAIYHVINKGELEKRKKTAEPTIKIWPKEQLKKTLSNPAYQKEKAYMKEVSQAVKEKLQTDVRAEEERRSKFMEDIEKWAQLNQQNKENE